MPDTDLLDYDDAAPEMEDEGYGEYPAVGEDGTLSVSADDLEGWEPSFDYEDEDDEDEDDYGFDEGDDYGYDEEDDEDPLQARLEAIADLSYEDPVMAERMRMELLHEQMQAQQQMQVIQQVQAARPQIEAAILHHVTEGVSPHVRAELEEELMGADPFLLAQIAQNPNVLREVALRVRGRQFEMDRSQTGARAPSVGRPSGRAGGTLSVDAEADVRDLMQQGFTREGAVRILREAK